MAPTAAPDLGRAYLAKKNIDLTTELLVWTLSNFEAVLTFCAAAPVLTPAYA
jgi:hypothetical protein